MKPKESHIQGNLWQGSVGFISGRVEVEEEEKEGRLSACKYTRYADMVCTGQIIPFHCWASIALL